MIDWLGKKVLVTGATGMLGHNLITKLLHAGAKPSALCRNKGTKIPECDVITGHIEDSFQLEESLAGTGFDIVFHLAAQSQVVNHSPVKTFNFNILGTMNLLEVMRKHHPGTTLVLASTTAASKFNGDFIALGSDHGLNPYVASKLSAELLCRSYSETYGTSVGIARLTNIYGPADRNLNRLVPETICSALRGEQPLIRNDPETLINCLYVDDVSSALMLYAGAIHQKQISGEIIEVYSNKEITLQMLVDLTIQQLGASDWDSASRAKRQVTPLFVDKSSDLLTGQLGWAPEIDFDEGLRKTIDWYRNNAIE